ncbi:GIY-YIG nuclease family protein [Franconibacter helveticus]|uniref:GIY-YIG nuclease family protein n=1 Tax=Franconibacter helveticus TaxID=357240 RepID=UPI000DA1E59F|nr:GIY-YIG nuclease family protein [Franconibacter helveticus]
MNRLIEIGFIKVGFWQITDGNLKYHLDERFKDVKNNLYAFICDGEVKYVGKTTRLLRNRMYHYSRPGPSQSTNIKNNANIIEMLSNNIAVDIFVLPDSGLMHYGQFHLNLAAGLEDSIISVINPEWNGIQRPLLKVDAVVSTEAEVITHSSTKQFTFNMTDTYWRRGFFNVPVVSSQDFGKDGENIKILLRDGVSSMTGMINRTANQSGSPRIMGGVELRQYFQLNYTIGDVVPFDLITQNMMKLK